VTDRHAAYIVVLDHDIRDDEAEGILTALRHVKFVASVEPWIAAGPLEDHVARARCDREWQDTLLELVRTGPGRQR
jgi:hypothetical protein